MQRMWSGDKRQGSHLSGLRRAGFSSAAIGALRKAYRELFGERQNLRLAIERLLGAGGVAPEVAEMVDFIRASKRGVAFGSAAGGREVESGE